MLKRKFFRVLVPILASFCCIFLFPKAFAAPAVTCTAPTVTAPSGGGTATINVNCTATGITSGWKFRANANNLVTPSSTTLTSGSNTRTATRQSGVTSPDSTFTLLGGNAAGFNGTFSSTTANVRFTYNVTTLSTTKSGTYSSTANAVTFTWRIQNAANVTQASGTSSTTLNLIVPALTSVSCTSGSVNATAGGGSFTLNVDCTLTTNATQISPSGGNVFSPTSVTLTNGAATLTGNLQSSVTSPDSTVTSISGTATGGFTGNIVSSPAKIRVQYSGTSTSTSKAGTYTVTPVTYSWSTI